MVAPPDRHQDEKKLHDREQPIRGKRNPPQRPGQPRFRQPLQTAGEAVGIGGLAAQVPLEAAYEVLERGRGRRPATDERDRRVAATDAEDDPAAGLGLQRRRGRGDDRGISRDRVRHPGSELQPLRRAHGERELNEHLSLQVLAVGEEQAVPALRLYLRGEPR